MPVLPRTFSHVEDRRLHEDVRLLGACLGQVIRRLEGEACFAAVEHLRTSCRARRLGESDARGLDELLDYADSLPLDVASRVARAFGLFFLLINTAEQVHRRRLHRRGGGESGARMTLVEALGRLRDQGLDATAAASVLERLEVRPVLTAHPTEATRSTVLGLQARVAERLLELDAAGPEERAALERAVEAEVELLWLTAEVRSERPSVIDEVSTVTWYLRHRLLPAGAELARRLRQAYAEVFDRELGKCSPLRLGSWVGGDRDGNPFVTPRVTAEAVRRAAGVMLDTYLRAVEDLIHVLSVSTRVKSAPDGLEESLRRDREELPAVWEENRERNAEEPLRLKLGFIRARLAATRERLAGAPGGRAGRGYPDAAAFERDLESVRDALVAMGARSAPRVALDPVLDQVGAHGFHGYLLDVRQDTRIHTEALDDVARTLGLEPFDRAALRRELLGRRPLLGDQLPLEETTRDVVAVFRAIRKVQDELGGRTASTYVLSMTSSPEDLLRVLLLAREANLVDLAADPPRSALDVVPLFETGDDLARAPEVLRDLFDDPAYGRQLRARGMRQEVMIGYSDSAKDVGMLPAAWALYRSQEEVARVCREAGAELTLFHGRGGTVGRGGGSPVFRALEALPPGTVEGRIKVTEQGEVISQKFGLLPVAEESLEVLVAGALAVSRANRCADLAPAEEGRFRETMDRLAALARPVYRGAVHDGDRLFAFFLDATPVRELAHVHFGSRPAYRRQGTESMATLRAIPWIFGWTQIRLNLPSWLGVGTALATVCAEPGGLELLRRMADSWCFFDDLLAKVEMICAKTDVEIARLYVERLRPRDLGLLDELAAEYRRTVDAVLQIRRAEHLLAAEPLLQTALVHRDPYLDPLSLLQVSLLHRKRGAPEDAPERDTLDRALGTTLNGVAQGLRNTG